MEQVLTADPAVEAPLGLNMPWIESPFFERHRAQANLDPATAEMVSRFARDGFLVFDPEIENLDILSEKLVTDLAPRYPERGRIQDAWAYSSQVRALAVAPRVLDILRVLYNREPIPFQTLNFPRGTQQATHSDCIHFSSVPERFMCGVWVALEDIDADNGPLHYYPGSHRLPIYDMHNLGLFGSQIHGHRTLYARYEEFIFSGCMYYTPLFSDPFLRRTEFRRITDIYTGKVVPHYYLGNRVNMGD